MDLAEAFTPAQSRILAGLHERDARERREGIRQPESLMAVSAAVAQLLYLLVVQKRAQTIVEFGTSHGYSTIHLAAAAERTGGQVLTVDALPEKTGRAARNLRDAGLAHRVTLITADGAEFARELPAPADFVLVDYSVDAFLPAFRELRTRTADGCLIFVDGGPDGYWERGGGRELKGLLDADPDFLVSVLPMHKDQLLAVKTAPPSKR